MQTLRLAATAFRANLLFLLLVPALNIGLETFGLGGGAAGAKLVLSALILFMLHRTILLGSPSGAVSPVDPVLPDTDYPAQPKLKFWLLMAGISLMGIFLILGSYTVIQPLAARQNLGPDGHIGLALLAALIPYWIFLALFGTAVPAAVIDHKAGLGPALKRARVSFFRLLFGLFMGPGLIWVLLLVLGALLKTVGVYSYDWIHLSDFTAMGLVIEFLLFGFGQGFALAVTAAVLSRAYLRGLHQAENAAP
ncbi:hypothetical protein [Roseobacter sp. S98]|uniref:hypothetical protein n=1 Tax=Roseobacter algicola (ex Choi et al. 2025) (nom. illeg.) TaxID=3092138 RepID=UPI0035C7348B